MSWAAWLKSMGMVQCIVSPYRIIRWGFFKPWRWRLQVPLKHWYLSTWRDGITPHKSTNLTFNTDSVDSDEKLPNLIYFGVFDYCRSPPLLIKQCCRAGIILYKIQMYVKWLTDHAGHFILNNMFLTFCIYTFLINGIHIFITTVHNLLNIYSISQQQED